MQITDEMVLMAFNTYWKHPGGTWRKRMRAALEAALGQKQGKKYSAADNLRNWAKAKATEDNDSLRADLLSNAACIEDLAAALKLFAEIADCYDPPEDDDHEIVWDRKASHELLGDLRRARATLEKWGLK